MGWVGRMFRSDQLDKQLLQAQAGDLQRARQVAALAQNGGGLEPADHIRTDDMAARAIVIHLTDAAGDAVALVQQMLALSSTNSLPWSMMRTCSSSPSTSPIRWVESRMQEGDSL